MQKKIFNKDKRVYWSHPNVNLLDHLFGVYDFSKNILENTYTKNMNSKLIKEISLIISLTHDFGKFSSFFQDYIYSEDKEVEIKKQQDYLRSQNIFSNTNKAKDHSKISALFTFFIVNQIIQINYAKEKNKFNIKFLPLISYIVVKRHHSNLNNFQEEFTNDNIMISKDSLSYLNFVLKHFEKEKISEIYRNIFLQEFNLNLDINIFFKNLNNSINDLQEDYESFNSEIENRFGFDLEEKVNEPQRYKSIEFKEYYYFILTEFLFSVLLDSDKRMASKNRFVDLPLLEKDLVSEYYKKKYNESSNKINKKRSESFFEVDSFVEKNTNLEEENFYSLTLPTGFGKTLIGFNFANKLSSRVLKKFGYSPKLIFSLPFTSIIEQNYDVFKKVLEDKYSKENFNFANKYILKHHYLSEINYKLNEDTPIENSLFYIENWDSKIIVTTFIQLFSSMINNKNKNIKRFHNLVNSIILLDEIQEIPTKYHHFVNSFFKALSYYFNTYIIFSTATKPSIFEENDMREIVLKKKYFFNGLDRVNLKINHKSQNLEQFFEDFSEIVNQNTDTDSSFMIIFNTIKSSRDFFEKVNNEKHFKDFKKIYLSTNIIPKERLNRIAQIKNKGIKKIIVTTQLIEAGVDIDIDFVFRDFAPIANLNQSGGRCNRNGILNKGNLFVINLIDSNNDKSFAGYIYDPTLRNISSNLLHNKYVISEKEFLELSNNYFLGVKEKVSKLSSYQNKINLLQLNFFNSNEDFKLIEDDFEKVDLFIELDDYAKKIWKNFLEINVIKDFIQKKIEFLKIKKDFFEYVISVPKNEILEYDNLKKGFIGYISNDLLSNYYDQNIGFIKSNIW